MAELMQKSWAELLFQVPREESPAHFGQSPVPPELRPEILLSCASNGRIFGSEYLYPAPLIVARVLNSSSVPTTLAPLSYLFPCCMSFILVDIPPCSSYLKFRWGSLEEG